MKLTLCGEEDMLLPINHEEIWLWLSDELKLPTPLCRTLYKYCINLTRVIVQAFTPKVLEAGYRDSGLCPLIFRDFMQRCPSFQKEISESDLMHMEACLPHVLDIVREKGEILPHESISILGVEWALRLEESTLCEQARLALMANRVQSPCTSRTTLNQRGTVILTNMQQMEDRKKRALKDKEKKDVKEAEAVAKQEAKNAELKAQGEYALSVYKHESDDLKKHIFSYKCSNWTLKERRIALSYLAPLMHQKGMFKEQINRELLYELDNRLKDGYECVRLSVPTNHHPKTRKENTADKDKRKRDSDTEIPASASSKKKSRKKCSGNGSRARTCL
jgi:hypothetical protein